jgi:hypothetical protein
MVVVTIAQRAFSVFCFFVALMTAADPLNFVSRDTSPLPA